MAPRLPPPASFYHRPPKELAGYSSTTVNNGDEVPGGSRPQSVSEAITLSASTLPQTIRAQPAALTDYQFAFKRVWYDASPFNRARLTVDVKTAGAAGAGIQLFYSLTGAPGTFISAGLFAPITVPIDAVGPQKAGDFLVDAAIAGDAVWAVQLFGGDGVASPVIDLVTLQFEVQQQIATTPETLFIRHGSPSAQSCLALWDGGWVDIFGVNGAQTLRAILEDLQHTAIVHQENLTAPDLAPLGWTPTGGGALGGWTSVLDDDGNQAIARAGTVLLRCLTSSQGWTKSITLPAPSHPCGKGYELRMKFRRQGGTWTVVGYPGQCGPGWGPTQCGPTICAYDTWARIELDGAFGNMCVSPKVAWYWMTHDLGSPWSTMRFQLPPSAFGAVDLSFTLGSPCTGAPCGVGYGTMIAAFSAIVIREATEPTLILSSSKGSSAKIVKPETDHDTKRASGGFSRVYGAPLEAQTIPAFTYQVRLAARLTPTNRYAQGHVKARVWVWRESDDSEVGEIGTVTSPLIDATTMKEMDVSFAGAQLAVLAGDRLMIDFSGSVDTPADTFSFPVTYRVTETTAPEIEYDGADDAFSTGSAPGVTGAASHIVVPNLQYTGAAP